MDRRLRNKKPFEDAILVGSPSEGVYFVQNPGREHPFVVGSNSKVDKNLLKSGTIVRIAKNGKLAEIITTHASKRSTLDSTYNPQTNPTPDVVWGSWPYAQGNCRLDYFSTQQQEEPSLSLGSMDQHSLGPAESGYSPLGVVCLEIGSQTYWAAYWMRRIDGSHMENSLTLWALDSSTASWTVDVGGAYSYPTGQDHRPAMRDWLSYDPQYQRFCCLGFGSSGERNKAYFFDTSGNSLGSLDLPFRSYQSVWAAGKFIKGWHSSRTPTNREGPDDGLIRAYSYNTLDNSWSESWTWDPQTALPDYQIATSTAGPTTASYYDPTGRWPVDIESRSVFIWVSGSKKLTTGPAATMITFHPDGGGGSFNSFTPGDDGRSIQQAAALVSLNVDTGAVNWTRNWVFNASHVIDSDSITLKELAIGASLGGSYGSLSPFDYFPASGNTAWSPVVSYAGLALEDSLTISPSDTVSLPSCSTETGEPVYVDIEWPIVPYKGPDWGGGGIWFSPSPSVYLGPKYSWFSPGHPTLCPLPLTSSLSLFWPRDGDDEHLKRQDNVGGTFVQDYLSNLWLSYSTQGPAILQGGDRGQVAFRGHSETIVPPASEDQCAGWTDRVLNYDVYMIPYIVNGWRLYLSRTGPDGTEYPDTDIGQYFTLTNSSLEWCPKANVYQLFPVPQLNYLLIVRDWFDTLEDSGGLENLPYPVIQVVEYENPSNQLYLIKLLDDYTTFYDETEEILKRVWNQYSFPNSLKLMKGSSGMTGQDLPWLEMHHLLHNDEAGGDYYNRLIISLSAGSPPTVSASFGSVSPSANKVDTEEKLRTLCLSGNKHIYSTGDIASGGHQIVIMDNN